MKQVLLLVLVTALAGCGGYHRAKHRAPAKPVAQPIYVTPQKTAYVAPSTSSSSVNTATAASTSVRAVARPVTVPKPFARGPIQKACLASERKARSNELCGCIQAVANDKLDSSGQRMAVSFYNDPHRAQEIRQSDSASHEKFWKDYRAYGDAAKRACG